ncbi:hypothetical protein [Hansschlegelia sp.]|uniref:hypothetical protein n=1 Tax=Hansschlegelia sp. TaxID=2041892 RepID=UPI002CB67803|nr:hypothetical protein [Hansschlegelia sp.]HVI28096.1 hypothetical protein [Hansschlegelia sp.]
MSTLSTADRARLADYLNGALGALAAGDFDHETALATVLEMTDAILDGNLARVRGRLDELDEYAASEEPEDRRSTEEVEFADLPQADLDTLMSELDRSSADLRRLA